MNRSQYRPKLSERIQRFVMRWQAIEIVAVVLVFAAAVVVVLFDRVSILAGR